MITLFADHQNFRGFTARTIERRTSTLRLFKRFIAPAGLTAATRGDVEAFLSSKPAVRTRHAYRSDLRMFYRWAVERGLVAVDPTVGVESIKVPKGLPRPIQPAPMMLLEVGSLRARRMTALALLAGLRCCEIANLSVEDVWSWGDAPSVLVRGGKGGKDRRVDMHPMLVELLADLPASGPVFPGPSGAPVRARSVSEMIARQLHRCGIAATPHQLRHTFGTEFARASRGDMVKTAAAMGHDSMNTTLNYVRLASGDGQTIVRRMFAATQEDAA